MVKKMKMVILSGIFGPYTLFSLKIFLFPFLHLLCGGKEKLENMEV